VPDAASFRLGAGTENAGGSAKVADQALPGLGQFLGKDPGLRDNREKVSVPGPPRDDMHVEVGCHTGAGSPAQVESEIETIGSVFCAKGGFAPLGQLHDFLEFERRRIAQEGDVAVRHDEHVARGIGEEVQNHERGLAPAQNKVLPVVLLRQDPAEDAPALSVAEPADVVEAPGRPEMIHQAFMRSLISLPGLK
jgi:hypothetical protein